MRSTTAAVGTALLAAAVGVSAAPAWVCPASGAVPANFVGHFSLAGGFIGVTVDAVVTLLEGDAVARSACVVHTFVNPNNGNQAFITYGNNANFANDTNAGCAFLDTSSAASVIFSASTNESICPLDPTGTNGGAWIAGAPAPAVNCPTRGSGARIPATLRGRGSLPDADGTVDSVLVVTASQWANITAGSFVDPGCVAAVADAGPAGVTAITLSLRADGKAQACVWARPSSDGKALEFKRGSGNKCPADFNAPAAVPFEFSG